MAAATISVLCREDIITPAVHLFNCRSTGSAWDFQHTEHTGTCCTHGNSAAPALIWLGVPARLNWQLHFGEPPKWSQDVKFILVDVAPDARDAKLSAVVLEGDAAAVAAQLGSGLQGHGRLDSSSPVRDCKSRLHGKVGG